MGTHPSPRRPRFARIGIVIASLLPCFLFLSLQQAQAAQNRGIQVSVKDSSGRQVELYTGSHALLIGVSRYSQGWPKLESVDDEIDSIQQALEINGFEVEAVMDPDSSQLKSSFEDFIKRTGYNPGHRLLFYYAGHGYSRESPLQGYLVPADAPDPRKDRAGFFTKALSMSQINTWCREMEAKHVLFLFDSCFSGTIFKTRDLPEHPPHITEIISRPVRQFISAGSAGEPVPAKSVFAPSFVRALRGEGDIDGDGYVTGTELGMYLYKHVFDYRTGQTPQYGKIRDPDFDEGDFVFIASGTGAIEKPKAAESAGKTVHSTEASPSESETLIDDKKADSAPSDGALTAGKKITNSLGMEFVYIAPGTFTMGSPENEPGRDGDEKPHPVSLTKGFYLQVTEVTQGQWQAVMGSSPSSSATCGKDCPVERVSWEDAQNFIGHLNQKEGGSHYRLPTEAEWEYAARAGSITAFANGDIAELACGHDPNLDIMAWYCANSDNLVHPAGQKQPNAWGLFDMHGNVWEWCQDWYGEYPSYAVTDPQGPRSGSMRVVRGGDGQHYAKYCRGAVRYRHTPGNKLDTLGLRLARNP
jgi:formylglycine-generating enzyme required for sulfatase activity